MIVITGKYGQLGNRLFVFGHFIGWGIENGVRIANPSFEDYAPYFVGPESDPLCQYPPRPSRVLSGSWAQQAGYQVSRLLSRAVQETRAPGTDLIDIGWDTPFDLSAPDNLQRLRARKLIFVRGWQFRDEVSFRKYGDAIRKYFTLRPQHLQPIETFIANLRATCDVLVGVHIRRGDYREFEGGRYFYEDDVYAAVMAKIVRLMPGRKVGFMVCSNGELDRDKFSGFDIHPGPGSVIGDMYSLAHCDYLVGPPSTYSDWASFHGKVPLHWLKDPAIDLTLADFKTP